MTRTALVTGASLIAVGLRQRSALWAALLGATFSFPSLLWAGAMPGNSPNLNSQQSEARPTEQQSTLPSQSKENDEEGISRHRKLTAPQSGTSPSQGSPAALSSTLKLSGELP